MLRRLMQLGCLRPNPGSHRARHRVRGPASGSRHHGRGANGQKSRSGGVGIRGFVGGQTPLHITTPKVGNARPGGFKRSLHELNLDFLQRLIDTGRVDAARPITIKSLYDAGIRDIEDGVKVLAKDGASFFRTNITIMATQFTRGAIGRIEGLGGNAIAVHHTRLGLRALCRPKAFAREIRLAAPVFRRDRIYYGSLERRGYLAPEMLAVCLRVDPAFASRYVVTPPAVNK